MPRRLPMGTVCRRALVQNSTSAYQPLLTTLVLYGSESFWIRSMASFALASLTRRGTP